MNQILHNGGVNRCIEAAGEKLFRGEIWEDDADNEYLKDFLACHFHRPILKVARPLKCGTIGIRAANQVGKTRIGELVMKHRMKWDPGNVVMYDISGDSCNDHMKNRFMPMLRSISPFSEVIRGLLSNNETRFDVTQRDIRFPGFIFRARPLNEASTQKITVRYGMISDAALIERNGQIRRARIRSRQHEGEDLWVIESQGGTKGDDFTEFMDTTTDGRLNVTCQICGGSMPFVFHRVRGEDFKPRPPLIIPSLNHTAWIEHYRPLLMEQRNSGFRHGPLSGTDFDAAKLPTGELDENEVMRTTHYECYHCGGHWEDDGNGGDVRTAIDHSSHYVDANPNALEGHYGFSIPAWINPKISYGSCLIAFKRAMIAREKGNLLPLQEFRTKWAGEDWNPETDDIKASRTIVIGSYETDPEKLMPNHHSRDMAVDVQKALDAGPTDDRPGSFWVVVREFDISGNSKQNARQFCESWEEMIALQKFWKVPNQRLVIDASKWPKEIMMQAAMHYEMVTPMKPHPHTGRRDPYPSCWRLLFGDDRADFKVNGRSSAFTDGSASPPYYVPDANGRQMTVHLIRYRWSNFQMEQQLEAIRSGAPGMPRFEALPREALSAKQQDKEQGVLTYEQQINARWKTKVKGKDQFVLIANRQAHYRDCELMLLVRAAQDGLLGHVNLPA